MTFERGLMILEMLQIKADTDSQKEEIRPRIAIDSLVNQFINAVIKVTKSQDWVDLPALTYTKEFFLVFTELHKKLKITIRDLFEASFRRRDTGYIPIPIQATSTIVLRI